MNFARRKWQGWLRKINPSEDNPKSQNKKITDRIKGWIGKDHQRNKMKK